jgi:hypothetical protein
MPAKLRKAMIVMILAAFVLPGYGAGPAQAQKLDALLGTWDVKMEDGSREFVWEFTLKDGKLAGKHTGGSGTTDMADLKYEDGTVKFNVTVGGTMVINFSASVAKGQLTGTLSLEYGEASISGTKRK